jgi:sporulation protein YlmC with PRC-barrel domain
MLSSQTRQARIPPSCDTKKHPSHIGNARKEDAVQEITVILVDAVIPSCREVCAAQPTREVAWKIGEAMKVEDFKKLAVVSIDSGAKLGYVDDLLFDTENLAVAGFHVKGDGHQSLLPISEVRSIGADAITVQSDAAMRASSAESALAAMPDIDRMRKLKVVDEAGNYIGRVKDVDIEVKAGKIIEVETHEGGVLGIGGTTVTIAAADIRSIGDEVMVVAQAALTKAPEEKAT